MLIKRTKNVLYQLMNNKESFLFVFNNFLIIKVVLVTNTETKKHQQAKKKAVYCSK